VALAELEKARQSKAIGKALEAKVKVRLPEEVLLQAQNHSPTIKEMLNCSGLEIAESHAVAVDISHADGQKCERCWHWETDVGSSPEHPTICARCIEAVKQFKA
jgi:isoleucyl-tRNA synthetase